MSTLDAVARRRNTTHSVMRPMTHSVASMVQLASGQKGKLYAIADLHLGHKFNAQAWESLQPHLDDSLIICGDIGENMDHLNHAFMKARANFAKVYWVPGNHELYTMPNSGHKALRGEAKYNGCVAIAQAHGILTPEDEWEKWEGDGGPAIIALCFTLYDYSFRPKDVSREGALAWAREDRGTQATDETLLHSDPYETRDEWCHARIAATEKKLAEAKATGLPLVIVNHWPLREDLITIPLAPRFTLWCGTTLTKDWHNEYNAKVVVTGHLHVRRTDWIDKTRFEEVSLGYPKQWEGARQEGKDVNDLLREILPGPPEPGEGEPRRVFRRNG